VDIVLELVKILALVFLVLYVPVTGYDYLRDRADKHAQARARAGRRVPVPVVVLTDDLRRGRAVLDGDDVRVHGRAVSLVLHRSEPAASTVRRGQLDEGPVRWCELRGFVDELGRPVFVGPPEEWEAAFEALVEAPGARARRLEVLRAAVPRPAVAAAAAALVVALAAASASVLLWPFPGGPTDHARLYGTLSALALGGAVLLLAAAIGTGVARARKPQRRLTAMRTEQRRNAAEGSDDVRAMPFRELARRVSTLEGWADEAHPAAPVPTGWQLVADAARSPVWWVVLPATALAVVPDDMPGPLRAVILVAVVVLVLRQVVRTLQARQFFRDAAVGPVTSEWDYVVVRGASNTWLLFLLLGETAHWAVALPEGRHPKVVGRCGIRGELGDGNDVRLVIEGETWIPDGPLQREDATSRKELRKDLQDRLRAVTTRQDG